MPALIDLEQLREQIYLLMKARHDAKELKLLNVGSDNGSEYHWRFRVDGDRIATISLKFEEP